ncbi:MULTISPECIES: 2,3-bisphosphoglycerate-independent phosphoglycerate mutase [Halolamina]|uniref:2,3-bisphosphoglycerate-independent phosphoglycerate mutase n=1 Tax=Halolamina pelagica TaxID=699431 RepID=A0A1I5S1F2_9EURY|nr:MULTISPECIES: 2,3-bisphosphoglycerate-independent phosphoglycerate mutase [Halolamina]NHX35432.1 2,3-bisphosphoglycerate-independent phosphoglycerate mutase [Halolamina sp. R1-12]SFP64126.1 phosphoglycerate mutase [Halolamina pelagica]
MDAALVILDGWGLAPDEQLGRDAVGAAATPNFDALREAGAFGTMTAHGRRVGLPEGQMGNSEVGHMHLGAGRVVKQPFTRINDAIAEDELGEIDAIADALEHAADNGGRVHFAGLVSDGGVHSDQSHLHALIELAADRGVDAVTHAFTDGRDTPPKSGADYLVDLEQVVEEYETGHVATVTGRYYAMDRDHNWERTRKAYDAIVNRNARYETDSAVAAIEASYERGETDEFVEPTLIAGAPALEDGDSVIAFNFRADRTRQLCRLLGGLGTDEWPFTLDRPEIRLTTMTRYEETYPFPVAFPPNEPERTLGELWADAGMTQLRVAESEKEPHVTYFFNGGRDRPFEGETRRIVASPDVPTYDHQPGMSAAEVTDAAVAAVAEDDIEPDALVLNYANPDMVGHTGDFDAAVAAVEAVDRELGRLADAIADAGAHLLVTADHGNADDMGTPESPHTAHTFNPVPVIYVSPAGDAGGNAIREGGSLPDVAPTILSLLGMNHPDVMTGESLFE